MKYFEQFEKELIGLLESLVEEGADPNQTVQKQDKSIYNNTNNEEFEEENSDMDVFKN